MVVRHVSGDGHTLIALADFEGYYLDHSTIIGIPRVDELGEPDLLAIAGYLNSSVANFFYQSVFATDSLQGEFSHVYPIAVKSARLPTIPAVGAMVELRAALSDGQWAGAFTSPDSRARSWAQIVAGLSERLHELARALWSSADRLTAFVRHRFELDLSGTTIEELAAGELSFDTLAARVSGARGRVMTGRELGDLGEEFARATAELGTLRAEASKLDDLLDEVVEDAWGLTCAERTWMHAYLAPNGSPRGNRLWPRSAPGTEGGTLRTPMRS